MKGNDGMEFGNETMVGIVEGKRREQPILVLSYVYSKQPILGLAQDVLESCPSLG